MHYLRDGLAELGMARFGKVLAVIFAFMCIGGSFGGGNMFQSNQAYAQISSDTVAPLLANTEGAILFGLVLTTGCSNSNAKSGKLSVLRLATTTSTRDSGLLDELLPVFEDLHDCRVKVVAVGSGAALKQERCRWRGFVNPESRRRRDLLG